MVEESTGWHVVNVKDAPWLEHPVFGKVCNFEKDTPFTDLGVRIWVLHPGKPNCRYHRENAQEDFLVLSGECRLLINDEELHLKAWDFVHCPPGVTHVFIGGDAGPCAILMMGHRKNADHELFYPANEKARQVGAEAPEPTSEIKVAYSDVAPRQSCSAPDIF